MPKVYLETTIPSYLTAWSSRDLIKVAHQQITRRYSALLKNSWRNSRMWKDPVVEEIRAIRDAYVKQFNYNLEAIYRDLKEQEAKSGREVISLPPQRSESEKRATPAPESEEVPLTKGKTPL